MIISEDELRKLSRRSEGSLAEVPFAVLLHAMAVTQSHVVLEIRRKQLRKQIVLEAGVPVECRSNLAHETLGRFMISIGRLDETTFNTSFAESCSRDVPIGEVLIEKGVISAEELLKTLQANLARKLLDGFTWFEGSFRTHSDFPEISAPLQVNVAQLIMLGVTRFATQEQIDSSIGVLIGKPLALNPDPPYRPEDIKVTPIQQRLVDALAERQLRIDELAAAKLMGYGELTRLLYALDLIGVVVPADTMPAKPPQRPATRPPRISKQEQAQEQDVQLRVTQEMREELMRLVLSYRRKDAFDLLGVPTDTTPPEIQQHYLQMAEQFAPWRYDQSLADRARDIFLAAARAYAELMDPTRRKALAERRERSQQIREATPVSERERFRIQTSLLDPEIQFKRGKALMASGEYSKAITQLEYASDLDPQNGTYRAELAFCRFLASPSAAGRESLEDLVEAERIDSRCGLSIYYQGEILRRLGRFDEAEKTLQRAIKPMAPDRRPIDALRQLTVDRKYRR